jgi:ribosome-associated translation inhibitor RaiA
MRLIIKGRRKFVIPQDLFAYAEEKFQKLEKFFPDPSTLEVNISDELGTKSGLDKQVQVILTAPGLKRPEHIEEMTEDFRASIDLTEERLKKLGQKYKDMHLSHPRSPTKYFVEKIWQPTTSIPASIWRRIREIRKKS